MFVIKVRGRYMLEAEQVMEHDEPIGIHFHTTDKVDGAVKFPLQAEAHAFLKELNIDLSGIEVEEI